ncbi:hypothetical protein [Nocardia sp. NBC_01327]|uniref:hypothetical protein n=1 Tax=Nocardia sp. NBC_01327 TaxID=2903593 RepID=UPI002E111AFE|nr:hypothetical protein OG326_10180 [Nocardia sp. NBC_01327]
MPSNERTPIFGGDRMAMSGKETDEIARSWPQLATLLFQLLQQLNKATHDGSVRLSRAQWKQVHAEAREAQKLYTYQVDTTQQWYQARAQDYQRESKAAAARAAAGASAEKQARDTAYLSGLRASVEHTIHETVLTAEERGQVVQTLDKVDADPAKPVARNVFEPVAGNEAVRARHAAAVSEHKVVRHREKLTATETASAGTQVQGPDVAALRRENIQRFDELAGRLARLEERIEEIIPRETNTATASSNGHAAPRKTQQARNHATAAQSPSGPRVEEQQHAEAEAGPHTGMHAEAETVTAEHPQQAEAEPPDVPYIAQMDAEQ